MDEVRYEPPPAFAPPELRDAPLNETAVTGVSSYGRPLDAAASSPFAVPLGVRAPRHRRAVTAIVAACVATALVTIGIVLLRAATAPNPRTLSLPLSAGAYTRVQALSGAQVEGLFMAGGPSAAFRGIGADDVNGAIVGLYRPTGTADPSLLFIGFTAASSPTLGAGLHAGPAAAIVQQVIDLPGSTISPQSVNAGPLGGSMRCATVVLDGSLASVGLWADHDTLGIVLIDNSTVNASTATSENARTARITRAFRGVAEH